MRRKLLLSLCAIVLAVAGCGGGNHTRTPSVPSQALSVAPASVDGHPCVGGLYVQQCALMGQPAPRVQALPRASATAPWYGIDFAFGSISPAFAQSIGAHFAVSYLSPQACCAIKNWTKPLWDGYAQAHIARVLNWEWYADRTAAGCTAGRQDAAVANQEADALGAPRTAAIYYSTDFQASWSQVSAYYSCARAPGWRPVGVYGGKAVSDGAAAAGFHYIWQTYAWSGGLWTAKDTIHQYLNGLSFDNDQSMVKDYGQVPRPSQPVKAPTGAQTPWYQTFTHSAPAAGILGGPYSVHVFPVNGHDNQTLSTNERSDVQALDMAWSKSQTGRRLAYQRQLRADLRGLAVRLNCVAKASSSKYNAEWHRFGRVDDMLAHALAVKLPTFASYGQWGRTHDTSRWLASCK